MHERTIEWDGFHREWRCRLDDVTVLITKTLSKMEQDLDWIDNPDRREQDVTTRETSR